MISTKKILTEICNSGKGKQVSPEELKRLQNHLIKMYRDIEAVCRDIISEPVLHLGMSLALCVIMDGFLGMMISMCI